MGLFQGGGGGGGGRLNEEAGYKSAIAGSNFRDFAWHLKWSCVEKKLLSLSHTINLCPFTFLLA